jgi:hypothetical protein
MSAAASLARQRKPYGLAFDIEDLGEMRRWAQGHRFVMLVVLDHVIDGIEFEEMVVLSASERRDRRVLLWRSFGTVYAQTVGAKPRGFTTVPQALNWLAPPAVTARKTVFTRLLDFWREPPAVTASPAVSLAMRRV